jgi:fructokinase
MIVVAGEALIDLILHPDRRLSADAGGGPFNTARTIGRLGGDVTFVGRLSTDRFGSMLREALEADHVELALATSTEAPTTLAVAELDDRGAATYRFHTAETSAPGLGLGDVLPALRDGPEAVHIGTLGLVLEPMATALSAAVGHLADDTLLMVDPNCRPSIIADRDAYLARLTTVLARADIVKVSGDDLAYMAPGEPAIEAARSLLPLGPSLVLLTDGARAVQALAPSFELELPVPPVAIVDTVGSGDAFGGAFLAWWVERGLGRDGLADQVAVREAVTRAIDVATLTCQRAGADPPTRTDAGWPVR